MTKPYERPRVGRRLRFIVFINQNIHGQIKQQSSCRYNITTTIPAAHVFIKYFYVLSHVQRAVRPRRRVTQGLMAADGAHSNP